MFCYGRNPKVSICLHFFKSCENYNMPGPDLLSSQGLRLDGRRPNELRRIRCKLGVFTQPDGSAYLEQGNTKVLAAVYGPHQVCTHHTYIINGPFDGGNK